MIYGDLEIGSEKLSSFIGYSGNGADSPNVQQSNDFNIKVKYHIIIIIIIRSTVIIELCKNYHAHDSYTIWFYSIVEHSIQSRCARKQHTIWIGAW